MKNALVVLLLSLWAIGTAAGFWVFEGRYLRPATRPAGAAVPRVEAPPPQIALATDRGLIALGVSGPVTVLNFWNPDCPCSRFAEADVSRLATAYEPQGVRFITIVASGKTSEEQHQALADWRTQGGLESAPAFVDAGNHLAGVLGVWAAPAAVILDRRGRVVYVGAYNAARFCTDPRTAWAAQALAAVVARRSPARPSVPFFGCQLTIAKN